MRICARSGCNSPASATLTYEEHSRVIEVTVDAVKRRVPVIAGTGSNSTEEATALTRCDSAD